METHLPMSFFSIIALTVDSNKEPLLLDRL